MANEDFLMSEEEADKLEGSGSNPGPVSPSAPPARNAMPPYFQGSLPPTQQHDVAFVGTEVGTPRIPKTALMPLPPQSNPFTNAAVQSTATKTTGGSGASAITFVIPDIFTPTSQTKSLPGTVQFSLAPETPGTVWLVPLSGGGGGYLDVATTAQGTASPVTASATAGGQDIAFFFAQTTGGQSVGVPNPGVGWSVFDTSNLSGGVIYTKLTTGTENVSAALTSSTDWASMMAMFRSNGTLPVIIQQQNLSGAFAPGTHTVTYTSNVTAGNFALVVVSASAGPSLGVTTVFSDSLGNVYSQIATANESGTQVSMGFAPITVGGSCTVSIVTGGGTITGASFAIYEITNLIAISNTPIFDFLTGEFIPPIDLSNDGGRGGVINILGFANGGTGLASPGTTGNVLTSTGSAWVSAPISAGSFSTLTSGTNTTAAMVVGSGASLGTSGTGTIAATGLKSATTTVSVGAATAPSAGQVLTATSSTAATWQSSSGFTGGVNSQTTNYTIAGTDNQKIVSLASGTATFKLPAAIPSATFVVFVENVGSGTLTLDPNGLTLDGSGSTVSIAQNQGMYIATDGTNYFSSRGMGSGGGSGVSSLNSLTGALNITAGSGISVTPSGSNIAIAATGGGGAAFQTLQRRTTLIANGSTATLGIIGDILQQTFVGTPAAGLPTATIGPVVIFPPSTGVLQLFLSSLLVGGGINFNGGHSGNYVTGRNVKIQWKGYWSTTGDGDLWMGMFTGSNTGNDGIGVGRAADPAATAQVSGAGFRCFNRAGSSLETTWHAYAGNGVTGVSTIVNTAITQNTSEHTFAIIFDDTTPNITYYIDGTLVATITTNLPASAAPMAMLLSGRYATTPISYGFDSCYIDSDI